MTLICFLRPEGILANHFVLKDNETFVGVGANVGKYSLTVARDYNNKSVKIIAIEAQPENYKALCRNIQLNKNFRNISITPINIAVSDRKGKVTMYEYLEYGYRTRFETFTIIDKVKGISQSNRTASGLEVECDTLDNILAVVTAKVDVMKIDIEGAEVWH